LKLVEKKAPKTRDEAAGELYRLAQAQTLIDYFYVRDSARRSHKRMTSQLCLDENGKIIPTQDARNRVNRETPQLVRLADAN
jgi:hypothetical protein